MKNLYQQWKWGVWRKSWLYFKILCWHKNAIQRDDYGSRWKPHKYVVGKPFSFSDSWGCVEKDEKPCLKTPNYQNV